MKNAFRSFVATLAVLAVCLVSFSSFGAGAIRWRAPGESCMPFLDYTTNSGYTIGAGLTVIADTNKIACPVPTGTNLVELNDTNSRLLNVVGMRVFTDQPVGGSSGTTKAQLWNYDFDGTGSCVCDSDSVTALGYTNFQLQFAGDADDPTNGCGTAANQCGSGWATNWLVLATVEDTHSQTFLNVKLVAADDT